MKSYDLPNWRIDNLLPFILVIGSFFIYLNRLTVAETKLDVIISNQMELSKDFKLWKTQAETRLGQAESNISVIQSRLQ